MLGMLALYLMVLLLSFNPCDPTWSQTSWDNRIHNLGGPAGAWLAGTLFFIFGILAYTIAPIILLICWRIFLYNKHINFFTLSLRVIGTLTLLLTSCGLASLNINDFYHFSSGGVIGSLIESYFLPWFNKIGSTIIFLCIWAGGVTLFTGCSWLAIAEKIGGGILGEINSICNHYRKQAVKNIPTGIRRDNDQAKKIKPNLVCANILNIPNQQTKNFCEMKFSPQHTKKTIKKTPLYKRHSSKNQLPKKSPTLLLSSSIQITKKKKQKTEQNTPCILTEKSYAADSRTTLPLSSTAYIDTHLPFIPFPILNLMDNTPIEQIITPIFATEHHWKKIMQNNDNDSLWCITVPTDLWHNNLIPIQKKINHDLYTRTSSINMKKIDNQIPQEPLPNTPSTPLPTIDLLTLPHQEEPVDMLVLEQTARLLETRLSDYHIHAEVVKISPGPIITNFELYLAPGVKASRISNLTRDLARSLSVVTVRVAEVIPGKPYVGLELPNKRRQTVYLRQVLNCDKFRETNSPVTLVLGKDISGKPVIIDLVKMPHLLIAGTTGAGKSMGVNAMILSILYKATPKEVRFIMIDPKMLELSMYESIPHLLTKVVTDMQDAVNALHWCILEMESRYKLMSTLGVRNLASYNERINKAMEMNCPITDPFYKTTNDNANIAPFLEKLPYIVIIIDEFADLIMVVGKKIEKLIARLAQKGRAAGIHLVLATQRPSVNVITGLIKANIPARISFTVSSKIDSRIILDQSGAESLLGMGDMLYLPPDSSLPIRVHGAFVHDEEVHAVVKDWKDRGSFLSIKNITNNNNEK